MAQRKHPSRANQPATDPWTPGGRILALGAAAIFVVSLLAYYPALTGGFLWDDDTLLTDNDLVKAPDGLYRMWCTTEAPDYWPLTNSTFWIEWRLWGTNSTGYHMTNLLLHVAAALLLWNILSKLSIPGAYLAALLFAVHPVNVESVAWIAQRKNTLAMVFFLLSIYGYLRDLDLQQQTKNERRNTRWYWLSLLAFLLAMLSKGSVAILPLVLLLIVWWQRRQVTVNDLRRTAPFFLVAAVLTGVNIWFQTHGADAIRSVSFAQRLAGAGAVVWFYLSQAILPIRLMFVYPQWHVATRELLWWLPLLAAAGVTVALLRQRRLTELNWSRPLLFAWSYFCVALVPVLGFTDVYFMKYAPVADHYQHLALIGVLAPTAALWSTWHRAVRRWIRVTATVFAVMLITGLTLASSQQSRMYRDAVTLWQTAAQSNPNSWLAHNNLGVAFFIAGDNTDAMRHLQHSLLLKPDNAEPYFNIANVLAREGATQEAIQFYQQALQIRPTYVDAHNNLGAALAGIGKLPEAMAEYQQALLLRPNFASAHNNLGNALFAANERQQAIQQHELALRLKPDYPEAHFNLAIELAAVGRLQEALDHYQHAIDLKPDYAEAYANLAQLYAALNRPDEAIAAAEKALELARFAGQNTLVVKLEAWLKDVRPTQRDRQN